MCDMRKCLWFIFAWECRPFVIILDFDFVSWYITFKLVSQKETWIRIFFGVLHGCIQDFVDDSLSMDCVSHMVS